MSTVQENVWRMEQAVLGAVMERPEFADLMFERLPVDLFQRNNGMIFKAISTLYADGKSFTPTDVVEQMRVDGTVSVAGNLVAECWEQGHLILSPAQTITTLASLYGSRDASLTAGRLSHAAATMDLADWVALAEREIARVKGYGAGLTEPQVSTIGDFLTGEDVSTEWLMPGLLARGTATMLTAEEGVGKSTILRQFALGAWAGIDPFMPWVERYDPVRTLLIDCENTERQLKRGLRGLWNYGNQWNRSTDNDYLRVESRQAGMNLSDPRDQGWLHRVVAHYKTELVVIGPVYRFTDADLNTEEGVRTWQRAFEPLMADGVAVLTEHHAPNGGGQGQRSLRPIGSSAMRRWFAQGMALRGTPCDAHEDAFCLTCTRRGVMEAWRGGRDDEARWPRFLMGQPDSPWWLRDERREATS